MKVLYFCEGFTDIRLVTGLAGISELTMLIPEWEYRSSGLDARIAESGVRVDVHEIPGRRPAFQARSMAYLMTHIRKFDVVLSQEMVRGSLNATIAGKLTGVPVVTYMGVAPLEYYRCRRERGQIGALEAAAGEAFIRTAMRINGALATTALCNGPYLRSLAARVSRHAVEGTYYGIDLNLFRPVDDSQRAALRRKHELPTEPFLIFFSSRISHEKDPETALRATFLARQQGVNAVIVNLGGGFRDFLALAGRLGLAGAETWMMGRPAMHPMHDLCEVFQASDAVLQSSLEEGLGFAPLEGLACGTPAIASDVGGMAAHLRPYAQLTPRRDADAMARAIVWAATHRADARAQAMRGCEYVRAKWGREAAFMHLRQTLEEAIAS